ncbi:MAG TPA: hypothetical protein VKE51_40755 [Vicinamibacterales bacterium]|nr:hypothetical protein [Vicinamibacterales bacterium]
MANEPQPEMTPEERERFERDELHHEGEQRESGPASEADVRSDVPRPPDRRHQALNVSQNVGSRRRDLLESSHRAELKNGDIS